MNVVHISTAKTWRGGEQQIAYLYEELHQKGIEQMIVCVEGSALEQYCAPQLWPCATASKGGSFSLPFARLIARTCKDHLADLIHIHDSHAHNNALLAALLFGLKIPMVLSRRVDFPVSNNPFSRWKYNYDGISNIICVSEAVRHILGESVNDTTKLLVIHDGIDTNLKPFSKGSLRREHHLDTDTKLIGNVAALAPHKDLETFLRTVARLKGQLKAKYFLVGEGGERNKIEAAINQMGLEDDVVLTGFRKDARALLAELDVLLVTSKTEGLGTTILDAFLCKVPVIATAAGGIPEIVVDGETGLLAPVKDDAMLAQQVMRLVNHSALKEKVVDGAGKLVREFSKTHMAERTLAVYKAILNRT